MAISFVASQFYEQQANTTQQDVPIPSGAVAGDYVILQLQYLGGAANTPTGFTKQFDTGASSINRRCAIFSKKIADGETTIRLSFQSAAGFISAISVFRGVSSIDDVKSNIYNSGNAQQLVAPSAIPKSPNSVLFCIFDADHPVYSGSPAGLTEVYRRNETYWGRFLSGYRKSLSNTNATGNQTWSLSSSEYGNGSAVSMVLGSNVPPTLTLTSPSDNQTLAEGNTMSVQGSAADNDSGNVVTVKYKINSGTTRALTSGVSDGSSPLSFAKTLTYSNKRIWDGSTDVAGVDLAENTNHTLTVWSEDDQGGKSTEVTRTFKVIWNRPPVIDGSDSNLGAISAVPSIYYTVTEPEGDSFTITELLNGQSIRSFPGVAGQQNTATIDQDRWLRLALGVQHELRIRATDSKGQFADRIYTFTRTETNIEFKLKEPFFCDAKPTRVLVTLDGTFPDGSSVLVEVCNNAYDASPTYEDATGPSLAGRGYIFTNETKTAADWGINIRITISKGTATEKVILNGFGGAFD